MVLIEHAREENAGLVVVVAWYFLEPCLPGLMASDYSVVSVEVGVHSDAEDAFCAFPQFATRSNYYCCAVAFLPLSVSSASLFVSATKI
mmetsp:Transcript_17453/g.22822  ORF Transcript_17453/g.22822 Transcript_17453/m.22822 type:complete len:89 (-) Transcript_17453:73-339(-)